MPGTLCPYWFTWGARAMSVTFRWAWKAAGYVVVTSRPEGDTSPKSIAAMACSNDIGHDILTFLKPEHEKISNAPRH